MNSEKLNYKRIAFLIISAAALSVIFNFISPNRIKFLREKINLQVISGDSNNSDNNPTGNIVKKDSPKIISLEQAYKLFQNNSATFIDARDKWDFAEGHIRNAINLPEYSFEQDNPIIKSMQKKNSYVIYCGGDDCDVSTRLAVKLNQLGYTKLFVFKLGWKEWLKANYPIEK